MYNRYVSNAPGGNDRCPPAAAARPNCPPPEPPQPSVPPPKPPEPRKAAASPLLRPLDLDAGDILVLLVLLLILLESEEDPLGVLLALGVFLLF